MSLLLRVSLWIGLLLGTLAPAQAPDATVDIQDYVFRLTLHEDRDQIEGRASVTLTYIKEGEARFGLDLVGAGDGKGMTVTKVTEGWSPIPFGQENDKLWLEPRGAATVGETRTFSISYSGVPADGLIVGDNKHGDRGFFGDNWPNRARHWLPVIDHPGDKATVAFIVDAPASLQVVAGGRLLEEVDLDNGYRRTHWQINRPLPTKVMVIGAARFAVRHEGEVRQVPLQSWVFPDEQAVGFSVFARAREATAFLVNLLGPFPYAKLANVQSRTRYGGMENAGAIFYFEDVFVNHEARILELDVLLAHEIAHQWFGDSVTEADWPHIWLSEGFATYYGARYAGHAHGQDAYNAMMQKMRVRIAELARQQPLLTVVQETPSQLTDLLNRYSYDRGAWFLHMLRREVGDARFDLAVRNYAERYRHSNARTRDFRAEVEAVTDMDLSTFFTQWLRTPELPRLRVTLAESAKVPTLVVEQMQKPLYQFTLTLGFGEERHRLRIDSHKSTHPLPAEWAGKTWILDPDTELLFEEIK